MWPEQREPPVEEPVRLEEAKTHLRVDHADEDSYIQGLISTAREYAEDVTWQSTTRQSRSVWLERWPRGPLALPRPPILSIDGVYWRGVDEVEALLEPRVYALSERFFVRRMNASWPLGALSPHDPIRVDYTAGYARPELVPRRVRQAILLLVGHWYEHREAASERAMNEIPMAVNALLERWW